MSYHFVLEHASVPARKLRILVIEDHGATGQALKIVLQRRGHKVAVALDGRGALALVREQPFDLIISDLGLPDIDGWALLGQLRELRPGMKAIAVSGHGYPSDLQRSSEVGYDRHLTKPVQMLPIDEAIAELFPEKPDAVAPEQAKPGENPAP